VRQKWLEQEAAQTKEHQATVGANKKRKAISQNNSLRDDERITVLDDLSEGDGRSTVRASRSSKARTG
jgi:hypothetical protein